MNPTTSPLFLLAVVALFHANLVESAPTGASLVTTSKGVSPLWVPKAGKATLNISIGAVNIDTEVARKANERTVVYSQVVDMKELQKGRKNVVYSRLVFDEVKTKLRTRPVDSTSPRGWGIQLPGDVVRITSSVDNSVQYLNSETLSQWSYRSAFFNGGKLLVEVLVDPRDEVRRPAKSEKPALVIKQITVNNEDSSFQDDPITIPPPNSLCNAADLRKPSADMRSGRMYPVGCTAWNIHDAKGCQLTAGHCFDGGDAKEMVYQLNVPVSRVMTSGSRKFGVPRHPAPGFQFAVDPASVQFALSDDEDYGYFGTFPNSNTGFTAQQTVKGAAYHLAKVVESTPGEFEIDPALKVNPGVDVTVTGFGVVYNKDMQEKTQAQQTHSGPLVTAPDAYHLRYRMDTTGGNSGSAVLLADGTAVGIHTNGGCVPGQTASSNWGSSVAMKGLQKALASPAGVCAP
jgi:V8-like Glu-specific endopeptidase